jgi:hypothetical protein
VPVVGLLLFVTCVLSCQPKHARLYFYEQGRRERDQHITLLSDSLTVSITDSYSGFPSDHNVYRLGIYVVVDYSQLSDEPIVHPGQVKAWIDNNRMENRWTSRCGAHKGAIVTGKECHYIALLFAPWWTDSISRYDNGTGEAEVKISLDSLVEYHGTYIPIDTVRAVELKTEYWYHD